MSLASQIPKVKKTLSNNDPVVIEKLVPVVMLVSQAGLGLRKGEIRGLSPEVAADMIARKNAAPVSEKVQAKAQAEVAKELAEGDKDLDSI
jgi:hypothetical protein